MTGKSIFLVILLMAGVLILSGGQATAQPGPGPNKDRIDNRVAFLKGKLDLTDKQADQIKSILEGSRKEAEAQRGKLPGDREAAAKIREEHRKATEDKIKAILSDKQKKEYDKIKDDFRQRGDRDRKRDHEGKNGGPHRGGAGRGGR
jgi:hypothetical protein